MTQQFHVLSRLLMTKFSESLERQTGPEKCSPCVCMLLACDMTCMCIPQIEWPQSPGLHRCDSGEEIWRRTAADRIFPRADERHFCQPRSQRDRVIHQIRRAPVRTTAIKSTFVYVFVCCPQGQSWWVSFKMVTFFFLMKSLYILDLNLSSAMGYKVWEEH